MSIKVMPPVVVDTINIFQSWSSELPATGTKILLPAIIVDSVDDIPEDLAPGTAILVKTVL